MARVYWWPGTLPGQLGVVTNIRTTIPTYGPILGMDPDDVAKMILYCDTFIAVYNYAEMAKAASKATNEWRDNCFDGPSTKPLTDPPVIGEFTLPLGATTNIVSSIKKERDQIVEMDNFTEAIGEAMLLLGAESASISPGDLVAELLTVTAKSGSKVEITFRLQKQDAMSIEFRHKGEAKWLPVAQPTTSPFIHDAPPEQPDTPELREYRGTLLKKNQPVGSPSPIMQVVTTP